MICFSSAKNAPWNLLLRGFPRGPKCHHFRLGMIQLPAFYFSYLDEIITFSFISFFLSYHFYFVFFFAFAGSLSWVAVLRISSYHACGKESTCWPYPSLVTSTTSTRIIPPHQQGLSRCVRKACLCNTEFKFLRAIDFSSLILIYLVIFSKLVIYSVNNLVLLYCSCIFVKEFMCNVFFRSSICVA